MTSNWVTGSASAPPSAWGSFRANRPAWRMASTEGWASVPARSDSSEFAATMSRTDSTAASRNSRFSGRSEGNSGSLIGVEPHIQFCIFVWMASSSGLHTIPLAGRRRYGGGGGQRIVSSRDIASSRCLASRPSWRAAPMSSTARSRAPRSAYILARAK